MQLRSGPRAVRATESVRTGECFQGQKKRGMPGDLVAGSRQAGGLPPAGGSETGTPRLPVQDETRSTRQADPGIADRFAAGQTDF